LAGATGGVATGVGGVRPGPRRRRFLPRIARRTIRRVMLALIAVAAVAVVFHLAGRLG
jgi:hypothetical protein